AECRMPIFDCRMPIWSPMRVRIRPRTSTRALGFFSGGQAGLHHLLRLDRVADPILLDLSGPDLVSEISEKIRFLCGRMTVAVFGGGQSPCPWFHVELASRYLERGVIHVEDDFASEKRQHEIRHQQAAFRAAELHPLLVGGHKGAVESC